MNDLRLRRISGELREVVTIRLVLPFVFPDGHELVFVGEGPTEKAARLQLSEEIDAWREILTAIGATT